MGQHVGIHYFLGMLKVVAFGLFYIKLSFLKQSKRKCEYLYWLRVSLMHWAGELVCGCRIQMGLRKLRPHVELQPRRWGSARALATEQKRNVQLDLSMKRL
jgi:hypothetical protein